MDTVDTIDMQMRQIVVAVIDLAEESRRADPFPLGTRVSLEKKIDYLLEALEKGEYPHAEECNLLRYLSHLTHDQMDGICALTWLGRGDFSQFSDALAHAKTGGLGRTNAPQYLVEKAHLADYLRTGLERYDHKENGPDPDNYNPDQGLSATVRNR